MSLYPVCLNLHINIFLNFTGGIVYNKTYAIERSTVIPIEISSGRLGSNEGLTESGANSNFRVHTIDLGNTGSGHASGGSTYGQSGSSFYGQNVGSGDDSRGSVYRQSSSSSPGQGYRRQWKTEGSFSQSGTIPPTFFQNSLEERDNVPMETSSRSARSRGRRQIDDDPYAAMQALVRCNSTKCVYIRCVVGVLEKDKDIAIALRSRLNVRAVRDVSISTYKYEEGQK